MSRIVKTSGARVYSMRPGDEEPYIQLWPNHGYLAAYRVNGTEEILWFNSLPEAEQVLNAWIAAGEDDFANIYDVSLSDTKNFPDHIRDYYRTALEQEDVRWYFVAAATTIGLSHPEKLVWLDSPNGGVADLSDTVCGPFKTESAARHACQTLIESMRDRPEAEGTTYVVGWSYILHFTYAAAGRLPSIRNTGHEDAFDRYLIAHRSARLLDGPHDHRADATPDPSTLRRFELCRATLGHGGLVGGSELERILNLRIPWRVPDWVVRDERLLSRLGTIPDIPDEPWNLGYDSSRSAWAAMAARYCFHVDNLSRADDWGFSGGRLIYVQDHWMVVHQTCTHNTVILCTEHFIGGWSWTRTEIAGIPLAFGPPPDWLAPRLSLLSSKPQFAGEVESLV